MNFFCTFFILIKIKNQRHLDSNSFLTQILYSTEIVKEKKSQTTTNFYGGNVCHYKIVDVCIPASHYIVKSCTETEEVLTSVVIKISSDDIDQYLPLAMWNLGSRWRHFSGIFPVASQSLRVSPFVKPWISIPSFFRDFPCGVIRSHRVSPFSFPPYKSVV